jgi:hypothetical protein
MALTFENWLQEKKRPVSLHPDIDAWLSSADNLKKDIATLRDIIEKKKKKDSDKPDSEKDADSGRKPEGQPDEDSADLAAQDKEDAKSEEQPEQPERPKRPEGVDDSE